MGTQSKKRKDFCFETNGSESLIVNCVRWWWHGGGFYCHLSNENVAFGLFISKLISSTLFEWWQLILKQVVIEARGDQTIKQKVFQLFDVQGEEWEDSALGIRQSQSKSHVINEQRTQDTLKNIHPNRCL